MTHDNKHHKKHSHQHAGDAKKVHLTWQQISTLLGNAYSLQQVANALGTITPERLRSRGCVISKMLAQHPGLFINMIEASESVRSSKHSNKY